MMKVALIGGGGLAREIISCFQSYVSFEEVWDDALNVGEEFYSMRVKGALENIPMHYPLPFVIAVGNPILRKKIFECIREKKGGFQTLLHPDAILYQPSRISIGEACILMPGSYLTTDICLEENILIHIGAGVHHDVHIKAHSVLMPGSRITCSFTTPFAFLLDTHESVHIQNKHRFTTS